MTKYLTIITCILFSLSADAQMSDSLANYYYYVNQAELMISENNLLGAEKKYEKAREFKTNLYGRDYYNLALLKLKLENSREAIVLLKKLASKGFDLELLLKKESFKTFFETKKGKKVFTKLKEVPPSYNVKLRAIYDSLFVIDSLAGELYDRKKFNYSVAKIDSSTIDTFMGLIDQYGFPSEDLIGIYGWFSFKPIVSIMSHHSRHQQIGRVIDFVGLINKSGQDGLINNYSTAMFESYVSSYNQYRSGGKITQWKVKDSLKSTEDHYVFSDSLFTYSTNGNTEAVDNALKLIGLPIFKEGVQLSKFNWENRHDFILGMGGRDAYLIEDKETLEIIKETFSTIEITPYSRKL